MKKLLIHEHEETSEICIKGDISESQWNCGNWVKSILNFIYLSIFLIIIIK